MLFSVILFLSNCLVFFFLFPLTSLHPQFSLKITHFCPLCPVCHLYFFLALIAGFISLISFFSVQLWDFSFYVTLHCWQLHTSFRNVKKLNTRVWMLMTITSLHCFADTKEVTELAENKISFSEIYKYWMTEVLQSLPEILRWPKVLTMIYLSGARLFCRGT